MVYVYVWLIQRVVPNQNRNKPNWAESSCAVAFCRSFTLHSISLTCFCWRGQGIEEQQQHNRHAAIGFTSVYVSVCLYECDCVCVCKEKQSTRHRRQWRCATCGEGVAFCICTQNRLKSPLKQVGQQQKHVCTYIRTQVYTYIQVYSRIWGRLDSGSPLLNVLAGLTDFIINNLLSLT